MALVRFVLKSAFYHLCLGPSLPPLYWINNHRDFKGCGEDQHDEAWLLTLIPSRAPLLKKWFVRAWYRNSWADFSWEWSGISLQYRGGSRGSPLPLIGYAFRLARLETSLPGKHTLRQFRVIFHQLDGFPYNSSTNRCLKFRLKFYQIKRQAHHLLNNDHTYYL